MQILASEADLSRFGPSPPETERLWAVLTMVAFAASKAKTSLFINKKMAAQAVNVPAEKRPLLKSLTSQPGSVGGS